MAPNLMKNINFQIQEAQQIPSSVNKNKVIPRHTVVKQLKSKDKKKTCKAARGKRCLYT